MTDNPDTNELSTRDILQTGQKEADRVVKNSIANILTGLSTALTTILVPPVLARTLSPLQFGAWSLILQIAGYISVLNLGMQGAVGRYVAYYRALADEVSLTTFVSTALGLLILASITGLGAIALVGWHLQSLFPQIPLSLVSDTASALCVVGFTMALGLVTSVPRGMLVGIERNEIVTLIVGPARVLLAACLATVALLGHGVLALAFAYAAVNLLLYGVLWSTAERKFRLKLTPFHFSRAAIREIKSYCGSTMIWSVAMIMISGLDVAIVGRLDFERVAAYAACVAPITVLAGVQQAMFGPLLQVGARYSAEGKTDDLDNILVRATRISTLVSMAYIVPLLLFTHEILTAWLGPRYAAQAEFILPLLLIGHGARLIAMPYISLLLASGGHERIRLVPLLEGVANLMVAIPLGLKYGASGVAGGVVAGAIVGQLMNYFYNIPRTRHLVRDRRKLFRLGVALPFICCSPALVSVILEYRAPTAVSSVILRLFSLIVAAALVWRFAIKPSEKQWVADACVRRFAKL